MRIAVEISMYPLDANYIPPIQSFIERVRMNGRIEVVTNTMSTQLFGEFDEVFGTLQQEIRSSFETGQPRAVFVTKFLGPAPG